MSLFSLKVFEKFGEIYFSTAYPGVIKGWHEHKEQIQNYCKNISRIAIGMPLGSEVDYIDKNTLAKAIIDRRKI